MVSLNSLITIGIIGAAALAFTSLGGAGGIGSRIGSSFGGGIRSFNENITSSFNAALQGLNPFAAAAEPEGEKINLQLSSDPSMYTDPKTVTLPEEYKPNLNGGAVDTSPIPAATPTRTTSTPQVISGNALQSLLATNAAKYGSYFN